MAKVRIPKRVGNVKIPKKVRRRAKKALRMAESPAMRELAAAALGAAATVRSARTEAPARRTVARATPRVDGDELAETIRHAALDGLRRFMEGFEEGLREAEARASVRPGRPPATAAAE
jgi:hypothetical protein